MGTIDELIAALQALKLKQDHVDKLWAADVRTIVDGILAAMDMGGSDIDIDTEQIEGGTRVTITDADGTVHSFDVKDGASYSTGYYYGQYASENELPQQTTVKGYAYVATQDPAVYYVYTISGEGGTWENSDEKFVTTQLETNLASKSQTIAPTTKAVKEGIEAIDVTSARSSEDDNELTKAQKYNASANINDRSADVAPITGTVKALGYKVLNPTLSFAEQVTAANTVYEIRDEFVLNTTITIPANCTLKFNGGKIVGGILNLNNAKLEGNVLITSEPAVDVNNPADETYKPYNKEIKVSWFGAVGDGVTDDSAALMRIVQWCHRDGGTIIFDMNGTYIHGDGIADLENDPDMAKYTGYSYERESNDSTTSAYLHPAHDASHPATIGRDITLKFLGFKNLNIIGNGSTIQSNTHNGICKHNAIIVFGACANVVVDALNVDGKRLERVTNAEVEFSDWSNGIISGGYTDVYESWMNNIWLDSTTSGYAMTSSVYVFGCNNLVFTGCMFTNAMMDGIFVNKCQDGVRFDNYSHDISIKKSEFKYNARAGVDFGQCLNAVIQDSVFKYGGYYSNGTSDEVASPNNHVGIGSELESNPSGLNISNRVLVERCTFESNRDRGVSFSYGTRYSTVRNCIFKHDSCSFLYNSNSEIAKGYSSDNVVEDSSFINSKANFKQQGAIVRRCVFKYDKYYREGLAHSSLDYPISLSNDRILKVPAIFQDNIVETDMTDLTYTDEETQMVYIDYDKVRGQAAVSINNNVKILNNIFKNICPAGSKSGNYFAGLNITANICKGNVFINDYARISYNGSQTDTPNIRLDGLIRAQIEPRDYSEMIDISDNSLNNISISRIKNVSDNGKGTTSERPDLTKVYSEGINYFDINLGKVITSKVNIQEPYLDEYTYTTNYDPFWIDITSKYAEGALLYINTGRLDTTTRVKPIVRFVKTNTDTEGIEIPLKLSSDYSYADAVVKMPSSSYKYLYVIPNKWNGTKGIDVYVYSASMRWVDGDGFTANKKVGSTSDRPALTSIDTGYSYYDTTLGKPIYWNGAAWVDANGDYIFDNSGSLQNRLALTTPIKGQQFKLTREGETDVYLIYGDYGWLNATDRSPWYDDSGALNAMYDKYNYVLLTEEPSTWATTYNTYYKIVDGVYTKLTALETWALDTYYAKDVNVNKGIQVKLTDTDADANGSLTNRIVKWNGTEYINIVDNKALKAEIPQVTFTTENNTTTATITSTTNSGKLYYTKDGSTPTSSSTEYSSAVNLTDGDQVKAICIRDHVDDSAIVFVKVATPVIAFNSAGILTITCDTPDVKIYYTIDGSTPTTSSTEYVSSASVTIAKNVTVKAFAVLIGRVNSDVASKKRS